MINRLIQDTFFFQKHHQPYKIAIAHQNPLLNAESDNVSIFHILTCFYIFIFLSLHKMNYTHVNPLHTLKPATLKEYFRVHQDHQIIT